MSWSAVFVGGLVATAFMTVLMASSQLLGLSRMSMPYVLGLMFTRNPDRAMPIGFAVHFVNGWVLAIPYALLFEHLGAASWWIGAGVGALHGLVVLLGVMPSLPGIHPRMASERHGPEPTRALEPPGLLALHYGRPTPIVGMTAHLVYGGLLGALYGA